MRNLHHRPNFDSGKTNESLHHSSKEHLKISNIPKFDTKILQNKENVAS